MRKVFLFAVAVTLIGCDNGITKFNDNPVISHRGAWKKAGLPKNSLASLKEAIRLGTHGSEFDVHLTQDDTLVVNHDDDFFGIDIETATYGELLSKKLPNGEHIPTVEEYLRAGMNQNGTKLIYEIKTSTQGEERSLKLTRKSVELVKNLNAQKWVEYICFDFNVGKLVHELDPDAQVAYLKGDKSPEEAKKAGYTGLDYHYSVYDEHPDWINKAHDLGLTINAWTVDKPEVMKNLLDQQVEYITTNEPQMLMDILKKNEGDAAKN